MQPKDWHNAHHGGRYRIGDASGKTSVGRGSPGFGVLGDSIRDQHHGGPHGDHCNNNIDYSPDNDHDLHHNNAGTDNGWPDDAA